MKMHYVILLLYFASKKLVVGNQDIFYQSVESCEVFRDITPEYRISVYEFTAQVYKDLGPRAMYQFVLSPLSVWIILAAIAEGTDRATQQQLFQLLRLPSDPCVRLKYYQLATSRYIPSNDDTIVSSRFLVLDEGLAVNPYWYNFVSKNYLLDLVSAPIGYDPQGTLNAISQVSSASLLNIDFSGNSVLVDSMDFNGLWATAFADAIIGRSPFYNEYGQQIGAVDLMRVKRRARIAFASSINAKVLELPIGNNDRYRVLFGLIPDDKTVDSIVRAIKTSVVYEVMSKARDSFLPVEIAIPRFSMTSEIDVKIILESLGVTSIWNDPAVTRYLTNPGASLSAFVQRSTVTLDKRGIDPAPYDQTPHNLTESFNPIEDSDFIANRPFIFGLFDTETYTCLMASIYSQPTYTF